MNDVELSNIEVKHPGSSKVELTIQNRKNVRLARCIQESHSALGIDKPSILMGDVCANGFHCNCRQDYIYFGTFAKDSWGIGDILGNWIARHHWNFISYLEKQGSKVVRAKQRFQVAQENAKLAAGLAFPRSSTPPRDRAFERNVTFSPAKKRTWSMSNSK
ncbi:hypothetical protein BGZ97_000502 [Linnemannia gamsii]|uniref:Uncharacterized protein n=1 Tax=Linnemannia gamsii TaxID=64522 RepID=A0A9P6UKB6_9FUNG|nr:hypothetical protein BGZ97_000502 [Linnemannia gamsii]